MANDSKTGANIKRLRSVMNLTQDDLARKADVKFSTLAEIETGVVQKPSIQVMAKIPLVLKVSIEDFLI